MKPIQAIYGKLSILCFFAVIIGVVIHWLLDPSDGMGIVMMLAFLPVLFVPLGFLFGILSAVKKEIPKYYRYIGFFLNSLLLLLTIFFVCLTIWTCVVYIK